MMFEYLPSISGCDTWHWIHSCDGVHCRQVMSMFDCTLKVGSFQSKSCVTFLDMTERPFQTEYFTMLLHVVCVEQGSIRLDSGAVSLPWWTQLVYPPFSSLIVLLTSSGFVLITKAQAAAATMHSRRIQLFQTSSFITGLSSSMIHFMLMFLVLLITGCDLIGKTVGVHIHGFQVHLTWRISWLPSAHQEKNV